MQRLDFKKEELINTLSRVIGWLNRSLIELEYDKTYSLEIIENKQKRSLTANAYAWSLFDKIATKMSLNKEEVYKNAVKEIGGVSTIVCVQNKDVDDLRAAWSHKGLGWISDVVDSKIPNCTNIVFYKGSSAYDSSQMEMLIENARQDCESLGIDYLTPEEEAKLLQEWK